MPGEPAPGPASLKRRAERASYLNARAPGKAGARRRGYGLANIIEGEGIIFRLAAIAPAGRPEKPREPRRRAATAVRAFSGRPLPGLFLVGAVGGRPGIQVQGCRTGACGACEGKGPAVQDEGGGVESPGVAMGGARRAPERGGPERSGAERAGRAAPGTLRREAVRAAFP